jgi:hypothetical protein
MVAEFGVVDCRFGLRPDAQSVKTSQSPMTRALYPHFAALAPTFLAVGCSIFGVDFSEPPSRSNEPQGSRDGGAGFAPEGRGAQGQCAPGEKVCDGACVSLSNPVFGCGAPVCDPCGVQYGSAICTAGACTVSMCEAPFADCDGNPQNGCETQTQTSSAHCGRCGKGCGPDQVCSSGVCRASCEAKLSQCGGSCVNQRTDVSHCGGCGGLCSAPVNGRATCAKGQCGTECSSGFRACPGGACKAESTQACGSGCVRCDEPASGHGAARCVGAACTVQCDAGYTACATGCCLDTPVNFCPAEQNRNNEIAVIFAIRNGVATPSECSACAGTQCCYRAMIDGKDYCLGR